MIHEYIHVGNGALYCEPREALVTERGGAAAVRDMKEHEADDTQRIQALQDSINAAYERLNPSSISYSLQQGVFVIRKDEE